MELDGERHVVLAIRDITVHSHTEQELQKSLTRYYHVLDNMLEGCQIIDFDWRYIYINEVAARHGHRKPEALLMHTMMEMYPGIENTELFRVLRRCMEERIPQKMENKFDNPDGTTGWFELSIEPVPEGIFILSVEITERKLAEEIIKKQVAYLTALREIDLAVLSSFDLNFTLEIALKQVMTQLGVDAADILLLAATSSVLYFAAGLGFRTPLIEEKPVHVGEGYAGRVVVEQHRAQIDDLKNATGFIRKELVAREGFVS